MDPSFEKLIPPEGSSIRCFFRTCLKRPWWHYHPEVELRYTKRGSGARFIGDSIESYRDGDLVLVGADLAHHWSSDEYRGQEYDREQVVVVQFLPAIFGESFLSAPELTAISLLLERAKRGLAFKDAAQSKVVALMTRMLEESPFERLLSLLRSLQEMAVDGGAPLASEGYAPEFKHAARTRLYRICQYVNDNIQEASLSQTEVAEVAGISPAAFSRYFKSATQRTLTEYVNELRVAFASRLLTETDKSVLQISMDAGFGTTSNFYRQFRQLKGCSPREFRRRLNQRLL
jgi:AraC-like DNA-binding protein